MLHAFAPYIAISNHVSKTDMNRNCLKALTHLDNITNPPNDAFSSLSQIVSYFLRISIDYWTCYN